VVAGQGSQHIVEPLAHNFTLIVTVFSIFAGSPAAGLAGFAFIPAQSCFIGLPRSKRYLCC
jgi:hypothetical protein